MKINNISTPLAVITTLCIIAFVMFIAMTATSEADAGFRPSDQEQRAMEEYYDHCQFKKALMEDLNTQQSSREIFRVVDISCDTENESEHVKVELIPIDKEQARKEFENWLKQKSLHQSERLKISVGE